MTENRKKILEMLSQNKISADEAYRLLSVIDSEGDEAESAPREAPKNNSRHKYLRVTVQPGPGNENNPGVDHVNIRVPMGLIRAGIKLTSLIPPGAADKVNSTLREKGIDFDLRSVKTEDIEQLIEALGDMEIDVESGKEKVKVFVE